MLVFQTYLIKLLPLTLRVTLFEGGTDPTDRPTDRASGKRKEGAEFNSTNEVEWIKS